MRRFRSRSRASPSTTKSSPLLPACVRLAGHTDNVYCLSPLPGGAFISGSKDGTIRVHHNSRGPQQQQLLLRGHADAVHDVTSLKSDLIMSVSADFTARVWNTQTGQQVASLGFEKKPYCLQMVEEGRVVLSSGEVYEEELHEVCWNGDVLQKRLLGKGFPARSSAVFVGRDGEEILWKAVPGVDGRPLASPKGKIVHDREFAGCTDLNGRWFADWSMNKGLRVLEAATWREKGRYWRGHGIQDARWVGGGDVLVACWSTGVTLLDVGSGRSLWHRRFKGAACVCMRDDSGIVVGTQSGNVFLVDVPKDVKKQIETSRREAEACAVQNVTMKDALYTLLQGECTSGGIMDYVMRDEKFPGSVEDWVCGHWVLMLGLRDGTYASGDAVGMEERWWRKELYAGVGRFECSGEEELEAMEMCFREARAAGVLGEDTKVEEGARHVGNQERGCRIRGAVLSRCEAMFKAEDKMDKFGRCLKRYAAGPMVSVLLSAALYVVGLGVGAQGTGSDDCKVGVGKTFGTGTLPGTLGGVWQGDTRCASVRVFSGRVFGAAQEMLEDVSGRWLSTEARARIVEALEERKMDIVMLCKLFQEQVEEADDVRKHEDKAAAVSDAGDAAVVPQAADTYVHCEVEALQERAAAIRRELQAQGAELCRLAALSTTQAEAESLQGVELEELVERAETVSERREDAGTGCGMLRDVGSSQRMKPDTIPPGEHANRAQ